MRSNVGAFWAEMAPTEHFVQFYDHDETFIETLADFVANGLRKGEACVVIVTPPHRRDLERKLFDLGIDLPLVRSSSQYIALDAAETLSKFMVADWPDERRFNALVTGILERATKGDRRVRAFGEMVALLWADGNGNATIRLEHLWTQLCRKEFFALFCAYPSAGFTADAAAAMQHVCAAHSKVLPTCEPANDAVGVVKQAALTGG